MALTKISTDGVKDDAITKAKIPADQIEASELANNAVDTNAIQDDAVTEDKLANSINTAIAANTAKVSNATHTGDVTGSTSLTIADEAVTLAKLEHGTSSNDGKFLRANNGADPSFESIIGGKILQTVNATTNSQVERTSSGYADTGLTADITTTGSNKVLIFVAQSLEARQYNATGFSVGRLKLVRTTSGSSSDVFVGGRSVVTSGPGSGSYFVASGCIASIVAEDTPGAGTHTYKTQIARIVGGGGTAVRANSDGHPAEIILMEVAQ